MTDRSFYRLRTGLPGQLSTGPGTVSVPFSDNGSMDFYRPVSDFRSDSDRAAGKSGGAASAGRKERSND